MTISKLETNAVEMVHPKQDHIRKVVEALDLVHSGNTALRLGNRNERFRHCNLCSLIWVKIKDGHADTFHKTGKEGDGIWSDRDLLFVRFIGKDKVELETETGSVLTRTDTSRVVIKASDINWIWLENKKF